MKKAKTLDEEHSSSNKGNVAENQIKERIREVAAVELELHSKDIFMEIDDVKEKPDNPPIRSKDICIKKDFKDESVELVIGSKYIFLPTEDAKEKPDDSLTSSIDICMEVKDSKYKPENSYTSSKEIRVEIEDGKERSDDPPTKSKEEKMDHQKEVPTKKDYAKSTVSLEEKKNPKKQEKVSKKHSTKILKNIKSGKVDKDQKVKPLSLRRKILIKMAMNTLFSQAEEIRALLEKCEKSQSEIPDLEGESSKVADGGEEKMKKDSIGSKDTNSSYLNKFQFQFTPANRLQESSTNRNEQSCSTQSTSSHETSSVVASKSHSPEIKSSEEVWEHFKCFLRTNKESSNRVVTDGSKGDMETSDCSSSNLEGTKKTRRESISQDIGDLVKTKIEDQTIEIQNSLRNKRSTRNTNSASALNIIQLTRFHALKRIRRCEDSLKKIQVDWQEEDNIQKKIKYLAEAKIIQKQLHRYFDVLCDPQKLVDVLKQENIYSLFSKDNLSNLTNLMELPLSPTLIRTFSSLFLFLHKSLYYEVPIENIFSRINSKNCVLTYKKYQERKAKNRIEKEMSETAATKLIACFNVSLEECRLKMNKIPHAQNISLGGYCNYINLLRKAANENIKCLEELLSVGSSVIFPVGTYLGESRKTTLLEFFFLDKRLPDVFL